MNIREVKIEYFFDWLIQDIFYDSIIQYWFEKEMIDFYKQSNRDYIFYLTGNPDKIVGFVEVFIRKSGLGNQT